MAAYNAGPGTVNRSIRKAKSRNFWEISKTRYLPRETKNYVPKMLAALILAKNPEKHGFDIKKDPERMIPHEGVHLDKPVDLAEVARKLKLPLRKIKYWNPELRKNITPPQSQLKRLGGTYYLRLPPEQVEAFETIKPQLALIEVKDILLHKINSGDTLYQIARKYKVSMKKLLKLNPNLSARTLRIGKQIAIPVPSVTRKKTI
jgi:membrane-bound lytic murein transglycosylase D